MATVSVSLPSDGTTADVSDYNTPITTIVNEFNGNIDNTNVKAGAAISTSKLATDSGIVSGMLAVGVPVQVVTQQTSAVSTGTTLIPLDDTIPQSGEGTEFLTAAIVPKSATNRLVIDVNLVCAYSVTAHKIGALFQDSTADAIAASDEFQQTAGGINTVKIRHDMVAGTTSSTTFKVRAGGNTAGTITVNGESGARRFGATTKSSITITEYKAT